MVMLMRIPHWFYLLVKASKSPVFFGGFKRCSIARFSPFKGDIEMRRVNKITGEFTAQNLFEKTNQSVDSNDSISTNYWS